MTRPRTCRRARLARRHPLGWVAVSGHVDGVYSRFVSPAIGLVGDVVVSGVLLTRSPATRTGW